MNAMPEKIENNEIDDNLAAVTDVEAGIRDFVRKDIAYLRKTPSILNSGDSPDAAAEATVNNVNTLIQRVAGASASEIDTLITELEICAVSCTKKASACSANWQASHS